MAIKVQNISKWRQLDAGKHIELAGNKLRRVRLEVNCPEPTRFDVVELDQDGEAAAGAFVAVVTGNDVIEFTAAGDLLVIPSRDELAAEVWYFTQDGDQIAVELDGEESFTKIASRRARNPELEFLMYKQQQNIERRMNNLQAEFDARLADSQQRYNLATGEVDDDADDQGAASDDSGEEQQQQAAAAAKPENEGQGAGADAKPVKPAAK